MVLALFHRLLIKERRYSIAHFTDEKTEIENHRLVELYLKAQYFYFTSSAFFFLKKSLLIKKT